MLSQSKPDDSNYSRREVKRLLRRHRGSKAELARRAGPNPRTGRPMPQSTITHWLNGKVQSARLDAIVREYIQELLASERAKSEAA